MLMHGCVEVYASPACRSLSLETEKGCTMFLFSLRRWEKVEERSSKTRTVCNVICSH